MLTRKAVAEDIPPLGSTLGSAFAEDPIVKWIFPGAGTRTRVLPALFSFQIRHLYLPHNEVYTTEDLLAAALWLPPGKSRPGLPRSSDSPYGSSRFYPEREGRFLGYLDS